MTTVQEKDFADGNAHFAAEVYNHLLTTNPGNILTCPLAMEILLALVHAGASSETAQQLSAALHLPDDSEKIQQILKTISSNLQSNNDYTLNSPNKIYIKNDYKIKDDFKKISIRNFNTEIESVDFKRREETVSEMNKWIEKKTRNKIKKLINSDILYKATNVVLINAAYFSGRWEKVFAKYCTSKSPFQLNNKNTVEIDMMRQKDYFKYYESPELEAKFLEMPYEGEDISLNFVLPYDIEGLSKLEARVADIFATPQYSYYDVQVAIPKFEIESELQFRPILQTLGITNAFEDEADFSGMIENEPTSISTVIQKVFIEVDERGTTAAAPINCIMELTEDCCIIEPKPMPAEFIVDHPFLFYIKFKDLVVFVGRFTSPTG